METITTIDPEKEEKEQPIITSLDKFSNQKSISMLTQITFKQVFENLLYQDIKDVDGHGINIEPEMHIYYVYLCKERNDFFTKVDNIFKTIIDENGIIVLKHIPTLLSLIMTSYKNLKEDKEKHQLVQNSNADEVIQLLFKILLMLFVSTNNIPNNNLIEQTMEVVNSSMDLINIKQIKITMLQRVGHKMHKSFKNYVL